MGDCMSEFVSWEDYRKFASAVKFAQRYVRTPQTEVFLEVVRSTAKSRVRDIKKGFNSVWRAQLGYCEPEIEPDEPILAAYPPKRMKPRDRVGPEGRANPKGISCFYCATTSETAMAEVRPSMGDLVSVGRFKVLRDVQIVDCSKFHSRDRWVPFFKTMNGVSLSSQEIEEAVWTDIDQAFSEPVTASDDLPDYVPTQILAELFKADGYGGVAYKSALTDAGYNLAFFDPCIVRQVLGELYSTKKVQFQFSDNPLDQYFVDDKGNAVRSLITDIRPVPKPK